MAQYKVTYTYTDYSDTMHGKRVNCYDIFEAESAQDAVDQCRQEFYIENRLHVTSVALRSLQGFWLPVFDKAWM